jgi:hypothetical protein
MQPGDRVKLKDRVAKTMAKNTRGNTRRADWINRRGILKSISFRNAIVIWDDRKTDDHWPPNALEKI